MRRIGMVIPLPAEGRALFGRKGWRWEAPWLWRREPLGSGGDLLALCSGPGRKRAMEAATWLIGQGASCLCSMGTAGGLSPDLPSGALVFSSPDWEGGEGEGRWRCGSLACVEQPVLTAAAKADLFRNSGALAVDLESGAVAAVAEAAGLPSFSLRAICDPAGREVPAAVAACLGPEGRPRLLPLLGAVAKRPALLGEILTLRRDFAAALEALRRELRPVAVGFLEAVAGGEGHQGVKKPRRAAGALNGT